MVMVDETAVKSKNKFVVLEKWSKNQVYSRRLLIHFFKSNKKQNKKIPFYKTQFGLTSLTHTHTNKHISCIKKNSLDTILNRTILYDPVYH